MPKFYFHLQNSIHVRDDEGMELPSLEVAKEHATVAARALMADDITGMGEITLSHHIVIANDRDQEEIDIPYRSCVQKHPKRSEVPRPHEDRCQPHSFKRDQRLQR
jgi:hypothetical protein